MTNLVRGFRSATMRYVVLEAEYQGWTFRLDGGGHLAGLCPCGDHHVSVSKSARDGSRSVANARAAIKRCRPMPSVRKDIAAYLYALQEGRCAGCGTEFPVEALFLDHEHVEPCCGPRTRPWDRCGLHERGLLCRACNAKDVLAGQAPVVLPPELMKRRPRRSTHEQRDRQPKGIRAPQ